LSYGKIYRLITWLALEQKINLREDTDALLNIAKALDVERFSSRYIEGILHYFYSGRDITEIFYSEDVANNVAFVSAIPQIRKIAIEKLQARIKNLKEKGVSIVLEGRVTGIEIAPDAQVKVFLTAPLELRAKRRTKQIIQKADLKAVYLQIFAVSEDTYHQRLIEKGENSLVSEITEAIRKSIE
jgi:cytidylate kinase